MEECPEQATVSWSCEVCLLVKGQLMRWIVLDFAMAQGREKGILSAQWLNPRVLLLLPLLNIAYKPSWDWYPVPDMFQCWSLSCPYPRLYQHLPIREFKVDTWLICGSDLFLWDFALHSTHASKIKIWWGLWLPLVCNSLRRIREASACPPRQVGDSAEQLWKPYFCFPARRGWTWT